MKQGTRYLRDMTAGTPDDKRRCALCIQKLYHRPYSTVGGNWSKIRLYNRGYARPPF